MEKWSDFFVAIAGASAALTGLIFVGVSISLEKILAFPRLADRALMSLSLLVIVLVVSSLCLVPGQPVYLLGVEYLAIGILAWIVMLKIELDILKRTEAKFKKFSQLSIFLTQFAILPYVIAGTATLYIGFEGIYWLVPAILFSFIKAVLDAWVLLVNINR